MAVTEAEPRESNAIAIFLAVTACVAALVGWRSSTHSSSASGSWQRSVRAQVKHDAALVEDVRFAIADNGSGAMAYLTSRIRAASYASASKRYQGDARQALVVEKLIQQNLADGSKDALPLVSGGFVEEEGLGLAAYLARVRDQNPGLVAIRPEAIADDGNTEADSAIRFVALTIPLALAFGLGALAQGFERRRRLFLMAGVGCLAVCVVLAVMVEVL